VLITAIHATIAIGLNGYLSVAPVLANAAAFILATLISYVVNTYWSFSRRMGGATLRRFLLVSLIGFFCTTLIAAAAQLSGLSPLVGVGAIVIAIPSISFLIHYFWTYQ
jgi:putative flippase GtrA